MLRSDPVPIVPAMATTVEQPAFVRVYRAVADEISAGRLRAGDRLPTERSLCASHGVSRATVRRAMASTPSTASWSGRSGVAPSWRATG